MVVIGGGCDNLRLYIILSSYLVVLLFFVIYKDINVSNK